MAFLPVILSPRRQAGLEAKIVLGLEELPSALNICSRHDLQLFILSSWKWV